MSENRMMNQVRLIGDKGWLSDAETARMVILALHGRITGRLDECIF